MLGKRLDLVFDADLGDLIDGHRVIARGLERDPGVLHYVFVPGLTEDEVAEKGPFFWYWTPQAEDDAGTGYAGGDGGALSTRGGPESHGTRDLGAPVPASARVLRLTFAPAPGWRPTGPWHATLAIDLASGEIT